MNSNPSSAARASWLRRIVRGQYGHGSPSTVMSQANRAISGFHGQVRQRARVRHRRDVRVVRALPDVAGGEAREPGAVLEQRVEVRDRHELGVRLAVHVDELGEEELDALLVELGAQLAGGG